MKKLIVNTIDFWLPISVAIIFTYGFMYYVMQQYIRLSANEVPAQYAKDITEKLKTGIPPAQAINGIATIDMGKSLSPFVIVLDSTGKCLSSTCTLNGACPTPPLGTLTYARQYGENRITWRPENGLRNAAVIVPCSITVQGHNEQGYVLAGRSMKETEQRELFLNMQIFAGIIITLIATFIIVFLVHYVKHRLIINTA